MLYGVVYNPAIRSWGCIDEQGKFFGPAAGEPRLTRDTAWEMATHQADWTGAQQYPYKVVQPLGGVLQAARVEDHALVCPHCSARDQVVLIDYCVRANPVCLTDEGDGVMASAMNIEFSTDGYSCQACDTPILLPLPLLGW